MRAIALSLLCVVCVAASACSTNVGPTGLAVGGPCIDELDCAAGSFCLSRSDFPDGTCTVNCRGSGDCRGGSVCIEEEAGVCLLGCSLDADCGREGYACRDRTRRGEVGLARVCVGD